MTLTLELPPELETDLQEVAATRGQDPATFAAATLAATIQAIKSAAATTNVVELSANGEPRLTWEEFEAANDALSGNSESFPVLVPEATTRAGIYRDHD